jgi:D-3-phosphoglycerate dehydrogenase
VEPRLLVRRVDPEPRALAAALESAVAFLDASMKVRLHAGMIGAARALRVVATATTGADHVDAEALRARGIALLTLKGQPILEELTPAAEHSWLLLMACARHLRGAIAHALAGGWERTAFPGVMLRGRTLGVIGCGRIGSWMARYAQAFGMQVLGYDPFRRDWPDALRAVTLPELLGASDFVTLHVHLSADTRGMIDRSCFEAMKPGAAFVNTSRGELIDEAALLDGLRSGRLAAAALDVVTGEPDLADHPLRRYALDHHNLILTPHIAGYSLDAVTRAVEFTAARILRELSR